MSSRIIRIKSLPGLSGFRSRHSVHACRDFPWQRKSQVWELLWKSSKTIISNSSFVFQGGSEPALSCADMVLKIGRGLR